MTISNNYLPVRTLGNGITDEFSGVWAIIASNYLHVDLENATTGVLTRQTINTDYVLVFDESGFTVTFIVPPPLTVYVLLSRVVGKDQTDPYKTARGFQGAVIQNSLNKLTAMCQDLQEQINRTFLLPLGNTDGSLTFEAPVAGKTVIWNDDEDGFINTDQLEGDKGDKGDKGDIGLSGDGSGDMVAASNLADLVNAATARTNLGLGSSAIVDAGTGASEIVQLTAAAKLPAVDGSLLTNITGALVLLGTGTASDSASLDFISLITLTYSTIIFELDDIRPATDGAHLYFRTSTDNGVIFDSGASDYSTSAYYQLIGSSAAATHSANDAQIVFTQISGIGNGAAEGLSGRVTLRSPLGTARNKSVEGVVTYTSLVPAIYSNTFGGVRLSTADIDAVQFLMSAGNITSGKIRMYGMKAA